MELLLLVFFCLPTGSEITFGAGPTFIEVKAGRDITLPCSLNTSDITNKKFEWKKDGRQVFLYDDGDHSNNANTGQDQQFIGRVSHFRDKLKSGDASITISNMKVDDRGLYYCEFPDLQQRHIFQIVLVVDDIYRDRDPPGPTFIEVKAGRDVTLPCSLNTTEDITNKKFEWKKDGRQVFLYDDEDHSNNVSTGQDQLFKGRVSHFPAKLKSGDASITIRNTTTADRGLYTCEFPDIQPEQIFYIKLDVVASPQLSVRVLEQRGESALLQCEARGGFPKPELYWQGIEGHELKELKESERGGLYDIILQTTVTKTGVYRCVVTHWETYLRTGSDIYVDIPVSGLTAGEIAAIVIGLVVAVGIVLAVCIIIFFMSAVMKRKTRDSLNCELSQQLAVDSCTEGNQPSGSC